MTAPRYFKVLNEDLSCYSGGTGKWTLGLERSVSGPLVPCENGIHACKDEQILNWLGPAIFEFEPIGDESIDHGDKVVFRAGRITKRLRWDDRVARLFACDCADTAIALTVSPDLRSIDAVAVARRFADGKATRKELSAARDASWDAAGIASWDAAGVAARAASWDASWDAAGDAARAAAGAAARAAARAAAWAAAWDAAGDAARDAARAAAGARCGGRCGDAAGPLRGRCGGRCGDAARAAAWDAARAAARRSQYLNLLDVLDGKKYA